MSAPSSVHDWREIVGLVLPALLVPAFVALVRGYRRAWRLLMLAAVVPSVAGAIETAWIMGGTAAWGSVCWLLPLWIPVVCAFAGFHRDAPRPTRGPWLIALPIAVAVSFGWFALGWFALLPQAAFIASPLYGWALIAGGLFCLATSHTRETQLPTSWPWAVATLAVLFLPARLVTTISVGPGGFTGNHGFVAWNVQVAQIAMLALLAAALVLSGWRFLRALPDDHSPLTTT